MRAQSEGTALVVLSVSAPRFVRCRFGAGSGLNEKAAQLDPGGWTVCAASKSARRRGGSTADAAPLRPQKMYDVINAGGEKVGRLSQSAILMYLAGRKNVD